MLAQHGLAVRPPAGLKLGEIVVQDVEGLSVVG